MSTTINPNKALWEKGDFTRIAESMRESGEALVMTLGSTDGLDVLDLGCGDGTTAVRPDRDGELEPQRPDARRPDSEVQLRLRPATSGRVRQSHDVGRRRQRDRAIRGRGSA